MRRLLTLFPQAPGDAESDVAGVDEAGRGCLAGPVVAAAVILPPVCRLPGLGDSKQLSPKTREELAVAVRAGASAWGIGLAWPREIDRINILQATFRAMVRAVRRCPAGELLIDGPHVIPSALFADLGLTPPRQTAVVRGDALLPAISAASVLAKTFRDKLMRALARRFPGYGFERHKCYGAREHLEALAALGPCRMHRLTFRRVRPEATWQGRLTESAPGVSAP